MKQYFINLWLTMLIFFSIQTSVYANWGWESTDDPVPYYHQEWGKWYQYEDRKVFMVQMNGKTYKYIFDSSEKFISGWITHMSMILP